MGYSNFKKLKSVTEKFNLKAVRERLFPQINPVEPSAWLEETLMISELLPLNNEKSKSERIVSPVLTEVARSYIGNISFFSGDELNVKSEEDLSGACDFFFTLVPKSPFIEAPIISLAEAKNEDMEHGRAQCAAQLYGAKLFNEMEGRDLPVLFGCATDGIEWQFMRFENNTFLIDTKIYTQIPEILGVWHTVVQFFLK